MHNQFAYDRFKSLLRERGISQAFIAQKLQVTRNAVNEWANGKKKPKWTNILELSRILDVTPQYLTGESDFQSREKEESMKIYISGPISKDDWYEAHFAKAERYLKDMGYETVNPVTDGLAGKGVTYKEYIDSDLQLLAECDGIFMLRGWQRSNGARLEHAYAKTTGMWIRYQG